MHMPSHLGTTCWPALTSAPHAGQHSTHTCHPAVPPPATTGQPLSTHLRDKQRLLHAQRVLSVGRHPAPGPRQPRLLAATALWPRWQPLIWVHMQAGQVQRRQVVVSHEVLALALGVVLQGRGQRGAVQLHGRGGESS
jgi:hypothetical protein